MVKGSPRSIIFCIVRHGKELATVPLCGGPGRVGGITSLSSMALTARHQAKQEAGPDPGQQQQRHEIANSAVQALGSGQVAPTEI